MPPKDGLPLALTDGDRLPGARCDDEPGGPALFDAFALEQSHEPSPLPSGEGRG
jgi:hypothetical protein